MRLYAQVSGAFFGLVAIGQLVRAVNRWPVQVADVAVPVWVSIGACILAAALCVWAFRSARGTA